MKTVTDYLNDYKTTGKFTSKMNQTARMLNMFAKIRHYWDKNFSDYRPSQKRERAIDALRRQQRTDTNLHWNEKAISRVLREIDDYKQVAERMPYVKLEIRWTVESLEGGTEERVKYFEGNNFDLPELAYSMWRKCVDVNKDATIKVVEQRNADFSECDFRVQNANPWSAFEPVK
jgi:hypothetical protein